jgi:putative N6-adenine-specific DNA methylase
MMTLVAPCAIGAEKVLANELKQLGFKPESNAPGRVVFTTQEDFAGAYRANLCLRTADRVYIRLASFPCSDFEALFEGVRSVRWQDWFKKDIRVVVDKVRTHGSKLNSEHSIQGVVHKAIYETLGKAWGMTMLPETGETATVRVYIEQNQASLLLDLSGMPLHRRGYRTAGGEAPIRETLASILIQLMNWRRKTPLHDAFCGSGTIPIEATLYAHNIAPGLGRTFALETLTPFCGPEGRSLMDGEKKKAALAIRTDCLVRITGSDIDEQVLVSARANAERACVIAGRALQSAGLDGRIPRPDFAHASFEELAAPYPEGLLLSNPPWGERLADNGEAVKLYSSMHCLFRNFPGWDFGFITSHEGFEEAIGLKATKKRELKSGNLDTRFYQYRKESE